jgi:hypothetical protein
MIEALAAYNDHPARGWFDRIGNGVFEDDHAVHDLPAPHPIYRFRRDELAAYIWEATSVWFVRPWQRMRGQVPNKVVQVASLPAALDELLRQPIPWWQFWR